MKTEATKTPGVLRIKQAGDIHLGHHQTSTASIIANLDRYLTSDTSLKDVDMLVLTGDIFDRLLHNADDAVHQINRWVTRLLYRCAYLDVVLCVVEGTPSHDRGQSRFFWEQKQNANIPVELHYVTELAIVRLERFAIDVLFVPDKWRPDTTETLAEVRLLMKQRGLEQVDFAIMHGAFEYQLPAMVPEPTHDSAAYLELVRYLIMIGHVHLANPRCRILPAGSFDRLTHGEEGPKGYFDIEVRAPDDFRVTFVENKGAKRYDTLALHGLDTKEANVKIRKHLDGLPKGSAIRLRCDAHDAVTGDLDGLKKLYPDYEWSLKIDDNKKKERASVLDTFMKMDMSEFVPIDTQSLAGLVGQELGKYSPDTAVTERCLQRLAELI